MLLVLPILLAHIVSQALVFQIAADGEVQRPDRGEDGVVERHRGRELADEFVDRQSLATRLTRRKLAKNYTGKAQLRDYVQTRAAHLAQLKVDEMVRSKSSLSGRAANRLIMKAANAATRITLEKASHVLN